MRHGVQRGEVVVIEPVPRIHAQAEAVRELGGGDEAVEFPLAGAGIAEVLAKLAGVQLNKLRARLRGGVHLFGVGIDKQTNFNAVLRHFFASALERGQLPGHIQPAFGGDFLAFLGHEANDFRFRAHGDANHLGGVGHFEIEPRVHRLAQRGDVGI